MMNRSTKPLGTLMLLCAALALCAWLAPARAGAEGSHEITTAIVYPFGGLQMAMHGTLTADKASAAEGETVTLTLATDEGYGLKEGGLQVLKRGSSGDTALTVTPVDGQDNVWTFGMPEGDYTVYARAEIEWKLAPPTDETGLFNRSPYFYIDSACEAHGTVRTSNSSIKSGGFSDRVQVTGQIGVLTATPAEGYVFAGWEVVAVKSTGEPMTQGYALPVEYVTGHYEMSFGVYNNIYVFRIRAFFEEAPQPVTLALEYYDSDGILNHGSSLSLPDTQSSTVYAGETVRIAVSLAEGSEFGTYTVYETQETGQYPSITYTSIGQNNYGTYIRYIEPTWDGDAFTFTVPDDIDPNDPTVRVMALFRDAVYAVNVPDGWDEKVGTVSADKTEAAKGETVTLTAVVAGNVTFDPLTDLHVTWIDGENGTQTVAVAVTHTQEYPTLTYYTFEFTMPTHSVAVSADFAQKAYTITRADVSGITPAECRPETTLTVAGFNAGTDHVYPRADAGDAVVLSLTAPNGYNENSKTVVGGIYYILDGTGERTDLALTFDENLASACSFAMPAGDITLHYEIVTAYPVRIDSEAAYGTFTCDAAYCLPGQTVRVTGTPDNTVYLHDRLACTVVTAGPDGAEIPVTVTDNGDGTYTAAFTAPAAPVTATPEFQMENVPYLSYSWADGTLTCTQETAVRYFTPSAGVTQLPGGLYVAKEDIAWNSSLRITGDVRLILTDGVSLTARGIVISGTNTLTVFGQAESTGRLTSTASGENPGIALMEGGTLAVHGGIITARGHDDKKSDNGGGAGIGGKAYKDMNGTLYVYGGTVDAAGGSALWSELVTDHDGTSHSYYYSGGGAGIGGGIARGRGTVVICGGSVIAQAGFGAGIGAGAVYGPGADRDNEKGASVTILGGYVRATPRCLDSNGRWDFSYEAIGGKKSSGTLNLGENMIVKVSGGQYTGSGAVSKCRSKAQVIISAVPTAEEPEPPTHSIVFLPGSEAAEGSMEPVTVDDGAVWQVPVCGFIAPDGRVFLEWSVAVGDEAVVAMDAGDELTVTANLTVTAVWTGIPFGTPDFEIPMDVTVIGANAFEGVAATIVAIPENCESVGDYAFRDCADLTMIRIPADCTLGTGVFDGCTKVYVFGAAGSPAESYCNSHSNCVFVEEGQP